MRPDADSPASGTMNEVTPIVVNGVMYLPVGNHVVALDPESGKEIWRYDLGKAIASQRGVAYWPGDKNNPPRIIFTAGHKMIGLNAKTGKTRPGLRRRRRNDDGRSLRRRVPTIFKNMIFVGMNLFGPGEEHLHYQDEVAGGPPGDSRAYDARTGRKLWDFHAIPHPGEPNADDWQGDSWKGRTGNNMWSYSMTVDEQRGIVYIAHGRPRRQLLWRRPQGQEPLR